MYQPFLLSFYFVLLLSLRILLFVSSSISSIKPDSLHDQQHQYIQWLKLAVYIFITILSIYQLPIFSDLTSTPTSIWNSLLPLLGIAKWKSSSFDGMAMCLGDGYHSSRYDIVDCSEYYSFTAMGLYAMILLLIYAYVFHYYFL